MHTERTELTALALAAVLVAATAGCEAAGAEAEPQLRACHGEAGDDRIPFEADGASIRICGAARIWVGDAPRDTAELETELRIDSAGRVRDDFGRLVLGVSAEEPTLTEVLMPPSVGASPTEHVEMSVNLDAETRYANGPFDPLDPTHSSDYQTSMTIYDPEGEAIDVNLFFTRSGNNTWSLVPMSERDASGVLLPLGKATLRFTDDGALEEETDTTFEAPWSTDGSQTWTLDPGDSVAEGGTGFLHTTSVEGASTAYAFEQDGQPSGTLLDLEVSRRGELTGFYSNGESRSFWILDGLEGWIEPLE